MRARLLERETEIAAVSRLASEALSANGRIVVIETPAGIGKTALLDAARDATADLNVRAQDEPGHCPKCGMKLLPTDASQVGEAVHDREHMHEHGHEPGGIEWEDDMVEVNRTTTAANTRWKIVDRATGAEGRAIDWRFKVGERVKIRIVNETDSDHPMHHPFHIHGAGRFLILARDGATEPNLVWKDTVLIPTGQTVDLLLELTHPGEWMAHCHIAEHHESGMHFSFTVEP